MKMRFSVYVLIVFVLVIMSSVPAFAQDGIGSTDSSNKVFMPVVAKPAPEPEYPATVTVQQDTKVYQSYSSWLCLDSCGSPYVVKEGGHLVVHGKHYVLFIHFGYDVSMSGSDEKHFTRHRTW